MTRLGLEPTIGCRPTPGFSPTGNPQVSGTCGARGFNQRRNGDATNLSTRFQGHTSANSLQLPRTGGAHERFDPPDAPSRDHGDGRNQDRTSEVMLIHLGAVRPGLIVAAVNFQIPRCPIHTWRLFQRSFLGRSGAWDDLLFR